MQGRGGGRAPLPELRCPAQVKGRIRPLRRQERARRRRARREARRSARRTRARRDPGRSLPPRRRHARGPRADGREIRGQPGRRHRALQDAAARRASSTGSRSGTSARCSPPIVAEQAGSLERFRALTEDRAPEHPRGRRDRRRGDRRWLGDPPTRRCSTRWWRPASRPEPPRKRADAGILSGMTGVVTGTLPSLAREAAESKLRDLGAKVGSSVSRHTTFLLAGDKAGSKLKKAQELGDPGHRRGRVPRVDRDGQEAVLTPGLAPEKTTPAIPPTTSTIAALSWLSTRTPAVSQCHSNGLGVDAKIQRSAARAATSRRHGENSAAPRAHLRVEQPEDERKEQEARSRRSPTRSRARTRTRPSLRARRTEGGAATRPCLPQSLPGRGRCGTRTSG